MTNRRPMTRHQKSTLVVDVARDAGEVVRSLERLLHAISSSDSSTQKICTIDITRQYSRTMTLTAPRTIAGQVAERLKAEILAGERARGHAAAPGGDRRSATASAPRRCARRWRRCSAKASSACTRSAAPSSSCRASTTCATTTRSAPRSSRWPPRRPPSASSPRGRRRSSALLDEMRDGAARRALHRAQPALPHDALRALRPHAAGGDDRRAARRVERLPAHLPRGRRLPGRPARPEHRAILAACVARDPRGAAAATREHLENTVEHVASSYERPNASSPPTSAASRAPTT